jgi:hypothetical protein
MADGYIQNRGFQGESRCEFERTLRGKYCTEKAELKLDGLRLCDDAGVGPEVDEDDFSAQVSRRQRPRIEPLGRAAERRQFTFDG